MIAEPEPSEAALTPALTDDVAGLAGQGQPEPNPHCDDSDTLRAYAAKAASYDERTDRFMMFRRHLVDALDVRRGDVVVDVGCGTGLCLPLLEEKIGPDGSIIAIDESVEMLNIARARAEQFGWSNVTFMVAPAGEVDLPVDADAALFCAVHDILRCPDSVHNILSQMRPGARVACGGGKWGAPWLLLLNAYVAALHRPFVRSFEGFDHPWSGLTPYLQDVNITEMAFGAGYVAAGRLPY